MVEHQQFPPRELTPTQIGDIYLDRPRSSVTMDLGAWFALAMGIKDPDLSRMATLQKAIDHIQTAGYDCLPHLTTKLVAFNEFNKD